MTAAWVSERLREAGRLQHGNVLDVSTRDTGAFSSSTLRLSVTYSTDTPERDRVGLILKRCGRGDGELEVAFYERAAASLPSGLVPECVASAFDATTGESHVLLVDATATHESLVARDRSLQLDGVALTLSSTVDIASGQPRSDELRTRCPPTRRCSSMPPPGWSQRGEIRSQSEWCRGAILR